MSDLTNVFGGDSFNPDDVEMDQYELMPNGKYTVQIIDSAVEPTNSGNGEKLVLKMEVLGGLYDGRILFDNLNVVNRNETAQRIAHQRVAEICKALNIEKLTNSEQMHLQPINVSIGIQKSDIYDDRNIVKRYSATEKTKSAEPKKQTDTIQNDSDFDDDIPF